MECGSKKTVVADKRPWNKGKLIGQKSPLTPQQVWAIRVRLQLADHKRDLALFNLALDSKLRGCDLVTLTVSDVQTGNEIRSRTKIIQRKTGKPVQFEITKQTREALVDWINSKNLNIYDWLFPSRKDRSSAMTTRQYGRIVKKWIGSIDLPKSSYATHSLRRTKATLIYRKTGNLRAVQLLLGHEKIDSTVKYLGVEVEDALALSESIDL
ncbi:tyrosine-type recombinase/integrase [Hellea sp.]|nr:tyrosine-type recombinase/integrase [Hellea sp.]